MTTRVQFSFSLVLFALLSIGLVVLAALNFQQRRNYQLPGDGVSWVDSAKGVMAWYVRPGGPGDRAGIEKHDILMAIDGHRIKKASDAIQAVFNSGVWSTATYSLLRQGTSFRTSIVIGPQHRSKSIEYYLELVGLLYLIVGAFIFIRRWTAPKATHFFIFCLASFVLYAFSYTGKLNTFDWTIYWLDAIALLLQPALFLHFCLDFPERPAFVRSRPYILPLLYIPGALLLAVHLLVAFRILVVSFPLLTARWLLDRVDVLYLALYFLAGAVALQVSYLRAVAPLVKQQLKWVTRGAFLAIVPFGAVYAVPYFLGVVPTEWMKLSVLSLIFIPLTFGYAILRHRLMDVDIIFRRGIAYTFATAVIVGAYFALVAIFADFFRAAVPISSRGGWIIAIIVTAFAFQPMANWIQRRLDRFFNREGYDYRRTLLEFAREITSDLRMDHLLAQLADRLGETLGVDRLGVFLVTEEGGEVKLVKSCGLSISKPLDLSFLDTQRPEFAGGYLFFDNVKGAQGFSGEAQRSIERLNLHYYLPFLVKGRTLGYLGLGKTRKGDFLSSEDVDLLRTLAGYVSVALENARLYESLEQKALEFQTLKDFSENIIESIDAGVVACDLAGRVEAWTSAMEKLYGLSRSFALGKRLEELFPPELLAELPQTTDERRSLSLYKFRFHIPEGRGLIVNLSTVPLLGKGDRVIGRLLIFSDLTDRVNLEDQLVQAEKLSSIGLLAAGVAHEVNTPLTVITSQAQMLARQLSTEDPHSRTLEKITRQAFRASEIVNSLLKFSRMSGGEQTEVDLNRIVRETLSLVEPVLRASRISVNAQLTSDLPFVQGDAGKLQQVFMNLIMNARDAMPHGGELTIASEAEDSVIHVEVSDNGVGIPSDHLNKIFDPFFTTKSSTRGTGLGLAVSYGIIREHGGKVLVESTVGRGTSFQLEFPKARKMVNVS